MNQNGVQFIKAQNIVFNGNQPKLSDGARISVKILESCGNGNFLVSFKGNRFLVKSNLSLAEGQRFNGVIKAGDDGKIIIVPESGMTTSELESESISAFLSMNGLEGNSVLTGLVSFFQQSGLKLDFSIIEKARNIGARFPGKEKAASEIAAMLLSKGIEPTDSEIEKLLLLLDCEEGKNSGKNQQRNKDSEEKSSSDINEIESSDKNAFIDLFQNLFGKRLDEGGKAGILTLLNQLKTGDKQWILLPYQVSFSEIKGKGIIRFLINLYNKSVEKIVINYDSGYEKLYFVLYYLGSKVKEIRFCSLPPLLTSEIKLEEKRLGDMIRSGMNESESVPVTYSASAFVDGFCSSSEDILVADVNA